MAKSEELELQLERDYHIFELGKMAGERSTRHKLQELDEKARRITLGYQEELSHLQIENLKLKQKLKKLGEIA